MATDLPSTSIDNNFKIPAEPRPLPTFISEEDESFVVLSNGSLSDIDISLKSEHFEPIQNNIVQNAQSLIKMEISQLTDTSDSTEVSGKSHHSSEMPSTALIAHALTSDLSNEEILAKLEEVLQENAQLKNTILQNNMSMKSQYNRIVEWQEDVQKTYQDHKIKFADAKNYIEKLNCENAKLKEEVDKYKKIKDLQDEELVNMKSLLREKENGSNLVNTIIQQNTNEIELEQASKKIENLELALRKVNLNETENIKMEYEKQIEMLQKQLQLNTTHNSELEHDLNKQKEMVEKNQMILETEINNGKKLIAQITEQEKQLNSLENYKKDTDKVLTDTKLYYEETIIQLHKKIDDLNGQLTGYSTGRNSADVSEILLLRQQLMNSQIAITEIEQKLNDAKNEVQNKQKEIEDIKRDYEKNYNKNEVFALQAQLELYKTDFEAERNTKELIKSEKDQIAEDLQNLQRRNQQLQEEIEVLRDNRDYVVYPQSRSGTERRSTTSANNSPPISRYTCPLCNMKFRSLRLVEGHIEHCINTPH